MLTSENEDGSVSERYFECNGRYPAEKLLYQILTYPNGEQAWTLYTDGENGTPAGEELSRPEDWPVVIKGNEVVLELTAPGEEYDEAACKEKIRQFLMDDLELSES